MAQMMACEALGACFRLTVDTMDKCLIVQPVHTESDVSANQLDLQVGAGVVPSTILQETLAQCFLVPQTSGSPDGGPDNSAQCADLPQFTQSPENKKEAGDDWQKLRKVKEVRVPHGWMQWSAWLNLLS